MLDPAAVADLAAAAGPGGVVTDPAVTGSYTRDWTGRFTGATPAVVRPRSAGDVAAVVSACHRHGVAIVPQGGNTGLVGGSVPLAGEVVVSLRALDALDAVDHLAHQVTAGAGVTLSRLQEAAGGAGLAFGVDLAARESATVGGMIATNAGGLRVLRYGHMRAQVVGVQAVLGDGSVVEHMGGLMKDNTGYDLAALLCGSEGTLGLVTAARLRLVPVQPSVVTALVGLASIDDAVTATASLRTELSHLEAVEVMTATGMRLVCDHLGARPPVAGEHAAYLLVECAARIDPTAELAEALGPFGDAVAVAEDPAARSRLWRYREAHTEAISARGVPHKLDVTLPLATMARFATEVVAVVERQFPGALTVLFGHLGDGNLHVNVVGPDPGDDGVDDAVLRLAASLGGSISAEHGIGTAKRRWLHLNRSPAELSAFAAIKRALDPAGILNPNVLLP